MLTEMQMVSTTAIRSTSKAVQQVSRRGFHATRLRARDIESPGYRPYHYPEGPRSSIPFDPLKRGFAIKYWGFMGK